MSDRIEKRLRGLRRDGKKALVTFITAGDPDLATTERLVPLLERSGADIVELGIPFSDPMADGTTIQLSSARALAAGTTVSGILDTVRAIRTRCQIPIVLMGYFNPIFAYGVERFAADAAEAGVDGVLLVDLPPEEVAEFKASADRYGLHTIMLLAPTSDLNRMKRVARMGSGFLYYVSVSGVTGARSRVEGSVADQVTRLRQITKLPVAVGFGISTPEQAAQVAASADAVVVGSALVKLFEGCQGDQLAHRLGEAVASLKAGIVGARAV
jgi:tryptophan synthase alpha chain